MPGFPFVLCETNAIFVLFDLCVLYNTDQIGISICSADTAGNRTIFGNGIFLLVAYHAVTRFVIISMCA